MVDVLTGNLSNMQPETIRLSSRPLLWSGLQADYRVQPASDLRSIHGFNEHLVVVFLEPLQQCTQMWSGRAREGALTTGDVSIVPAATPNRWAWQGTAVTFHLRIPHEVLGIAADEMTGTKQEHRIELLDAFRSQDIRLRQIAVHLFHEMSVGAVDRLYADQLGLELKSHLLRHYSNGGPKFFKTGGQLDKRKLNRVLALMEARLADQLSLDDLAAEAGVNRYWFCKSFHKAVGYSPYQFLIRLRVQSAARLLTERKLSLRDIAQVTGFSDQAHLSRHFRRLMAQPPGQFKRRAKNVQD